MKAYICSNYNTCIQTNEDFCTQFLSDMSRAEYGSTKCNYVYANAYTNANLHKCIMQTPAPYLNALLDMPYTYHMHILELCVSFEFAFFVTMNLECR